MLFGPKNASSEFQKIINKIFNSCTKIIIVYIDDVLIFSNFIEQHFKHLQTFLNLVIRNGLVLSKMKIEIFQIKVRFLGHDLEQGAVKPIKRATKFANKFPDIILDKNQLQRFIRSLNYVFDHFQNLKILAKLL